MVCGDVKLILEIVDVIMRFVSSMGQVTAVMHAIIPAVIMIMMITKCPSWGHFAFGNILWLYMCHISAGK